MINPEEVETVDPQQEKPIVSQGRVKLARPVNEGGALGFR